MVFTLLATTTLGRLLNTNGIPSPLPTTIQETENIVNNNSKTANYDQLLPGEGNLWSSILDSVSNNREKSNLPTKKVIVLGERNAGKSTLVSYLSATNPPPTDPNLNNNNHNNNNSNSNNNPSIPVPVNDGDDVDMGTSYTTVEIGDDGEDDPLVRLSLHQIPSALPPYSNLLPLILNADSLRESLILVLIPFTHPHSLLTSLVRWLVLIRSVIKSIKDTIKPAEGGQPAERGEYIIEESKEALEYQYRSYVEAVGQPSASTNGEPSGEGGNTNIHLDLPLPPGTLTENMGIGIVVVCTKSDEIDELEKEKDFKEEQFDFIQQVLRSICLRFGGALFFTNQKKPESLLRLRSYVLHRLFGQLVSTSTVPGTSATAGTATTNARLFPFPYKANVVDRDEVLIPMGWDSWGKIKILRDGFDPSVVGNGWLFDLEKPLRTRPDRVGDDRQEGGSSLDDDQVGYDSEGRKIVSACKLWEDMIGETDDEVPLINPHDRVIATQEQQFLRTKYDAIKKERDLDPRSHFQLNHKGHSAQQAVKFTNGTILSDKSLINGAGPGVAGLGTAGVEEEITAQLNKLSSLRDQQGNSNGRSSNASLSPVEIIHMQQQQQQQQQQGQGSMHQTPRTGLTIGTGGTQSKGHLQSAGGPGSPLASRSSSQLAHQHQILMGLNSSAAASSTPVGTPGGSQGEKAMLANFFGKLLDKDSVGARGFSSSSSASSLSINHPGQLNLPPPSSSSSSGTVAPNSNSFLKSPTSVPSNPLGSSTRKTSNGSLQDD
ncbi:hypothetical protein PtB15_6B571 [Puccinia triticina]|nr:hypothetical protein PtB15_6B571 [Puccinia triticina]